MKINHFFILAVFSLMTIISAPAWADDNADKRHPSYNLMGRDNPPADSPLNPNFVVAEEAGLSESGFWRGSYLPERLVGLTVADIDGDGKSEVIYASNKNVYVTRFAADKLSTLATYSVSTTETIVSVDALNLTGGRGMEVIISAQTDKMASAGAILQFDGQSLIPLAKNLPWYMRVVGSPSGRFLAGQKNSSSRRQVYSGNVMRLSFDGKTISTQGKVSLPSFVNLFNFTIGNLGSTNIPMVAAIKFPSEHLLLFENSNDRVWESKDEYGGTMTHLKPFDPGGETAANKEFLPSRVLIADIDRDGQNELIVAKNDRGGVPFMSNQRGFTTGVIQAFKYSNMSLTPFFRTRTLPGAAVDYQVADFNNNGALDLIVAVVIEPGSGMLKDARSVIVAYEITANPNASPAQSSGAKPKTGNKK